MARISSPVVFPTDAARRASCAVGLDEECRIELIGFVGVVRVHSQVSIEHRVTKRDGFFRHCTTRRVRVVLEQVVQVQQELDRADMRRHDRRRSRQTRIAGSRKRAMPRPLKDAVDVLQKRGVLRSSVHGKQRRTDPPRCRTVFGRGLAAKRRLIVTFDRESPEDTIVAADLPADGFVSQQLPLLKQPVLARTPSDPAGDSTCLGSRRQAQACCP